MASVVITGEIASHPADEASACGLEDFGNTGVDKEPDRRNQTAAGVPGSEPPVLTVRHFAVAEVSHHKSALLNVNVGVDGSSVTNEIESWRMISVTKESPTTTVTSVAPVATAGVNAASRITTGSTVVLNPAATAGAMAAVEIDATDSVTETPVLTCGAFAATSKSSAGTLRETPVLITGVDAAMATSVTGNDTLTPETTDGASGETDRFACGGKADPPDATAGAVAATVMLPAGIASETPVLTSGTAAASSTDALGATISAASTVGA